ncbi:MAG: HAD-IA family hydrolase [Proteobacteria bacterium]|nr:HAD-IA family hydrolase [Pseudomonadota bacterium]
MSQPRLAVFDCDGTLVDSQHNIVAAMAAAWRAQGLQPLPASSVRRVVGLPLLEAISRLHPLGSDEVHLLLTDYYKKAFHGMRQEPDHREPLYPGAVEALDAMEAVGYLLAVATGKSRRGLDATLERHGLEGRFLTLKTADDGPGKPHPHMLEEAMAEAGAGQDSTVMIGDTVFDIEMASNAQVHSIGVSWGYHDPGELRAAGAAGVIDEFGELADMTATLLMR